MRLGVPQRRGLPARLPPGAAWGGLPPRGKSATPRRKAAFTHPPLRTLRPRSPALEFLAKLARKYGGRVSELLEARREQQAKFDAGEVPHFLESTKKASRGVGLFWCLVG